LNVIINQRQLKQHMSNHYKYLNNGMRRTDRQTGGNSSIAYTVLCSRVGKTETKQETKFKLWT